MIFDHFHGGESKFCYSIRNRSASTAVVATATVVVSVSIPIGGGIRIASNVSGNGAGLDLVNQILVLLGLRSRQAQSLILVTQSLGLFGVHVVDDTVAQLVNGLKCVAVIRLWTGS